MRKRPTSLFRRILLQFILAVILFTGLFAVVFLCSDILPRMEENAYSLLSQRTQSRAGFLSNAMAQRWTNFETSEKNILDIVQKVLSAKGATWSDMRSDAALNEELIDAIAPEITTMLRRNAVTGAFVVLNGAGVLNRPAEEVRAGLYIRDLDPESSSSYSLTGSDLLMERGLSSISKSLRIPLDSYWSAGFHFSSEENLPNEQFFFAPFNAALKGTAVESSLYGYWSPSFSLSGNDGQVITYSIPLIAADGTVFGVMGIDLTQSYLLSMLNYSDLWPNKKGTYFLGITEDSGSTFKQVAVSGISYRRFFSQEGVLLSGGTVYGNIIRLESQNRNGGALASVENLQLYNVNTPFSGQQWVLMGIVEKEELLSFSSQVLQLIYLALSLAMILGLIGAVAASRLITRPIILLAAELKTSNPEQALALSKLNIAEIDQLTASIEDLSSAVAESASKISKIIAMTGAPIGVFEYAKDSSSVFLSRSLFDLMGWPPCQGEYGYMEAGDFNRRLKELKRNREEGEQDIFRLTAGGEERWVQIHSVQEGSDTLGTVMDVTREVLDKRQMAYERDYDVLTDLYNRRGFVEHCGRLLLNPGEAKVCALAMWDMDNLKYINDTYGHNVGDEYIQAFAQCLRGRDHDRIMAARRSGDEFYALVYGYNNKAEALRVIREICQEIDNTTISLPSGLPYRLRASCGLAWYPGDTTILEDLVRYADFAMYQAKHNRKGELEEFNRLLYEGNDVLLSGQEALNNLIEQALIDYAMQPILCVKTGRIFGYEMLMRPRSRDFASPRDVLRMARSHAQLCRVERLTWFAAMQTFVNCVQIGTISPDSRVFIHTIPNCSMNSADIASFEEQFGQHLTQVVLEIPQQGGPSSEGFLKDKLQTASRWGAKVAIDDYGVNDTGESMLLALSPQMVKIGMAVIRGIEADPERQQMLSAIIGHCRERGIEVVAECVETREEMETLVSCGVDYLQGYYISLPSMPPLMPGRDILSQVKEAQEKFCYKNATIPHKAITYFDIPQ